METEVLSAPGKVTVPDQGVVLTRDEAYLVYRLIMLRAGGRGCRNVALGGLIHKPFTRLPATPPVSLAAALEIDEFL